MRSNRGVTRKKKRGETWWSKVYGIYRLNPSLSSNLAKLTRIPTSMGQWQHSCLGEKLSRKKSMVITVTTNNKFSPSSLSVNGMLGMEALVVLVQFSWTVADKRDKPLLHVWGSIYGQTEIAVARSYSRMIRGAWTPSTLWDWDPDWDPAPGLVLVQ